MAQPGRSCCVNRDGQCCEAAEWALRPRSQRFSGAPIQGSQADVISAFHAVAQYAEQLRGALLPRADEFALYCSSCWRLLCDPRILWPYFKRGQIEPLEAMATKFEESVEPRGRGEILRQYRGFRMAISSKPPGKAAWSVPEATRRAFQRQSLSEKSGDKFEDPRQIRIPKGRDEPHKGHVY